MDAADRWLRKNDPKYHQDQKILRKKKQERKDFYANPSNRAFRGDKQFRKGD